VTIVRLLNPSDPQTPEPGSGGWQAGSARWKVKKAAFAVARSLLNIS